MTERAELIPDSKQCPICSQVLALTEFGICRARKDGRNLYCKGCIRRKVTESRRALKAYKSVRQQYLTQRVLEPGAEFPEDTEVLSARQQYVARQVSKMTPVERVREAIRNGARTQKEIAHETKLGKDEIGDALANLLLWTREIRTEVIENTRMYFISELPPELAINEEAGQSLPVPPRKRDVPSSFSSLQVLMPGKNPEGEPEKIAGWVAA
jgi:hypothetical protein